MASDFIYFLSSLPHLRLSGEQCPAWEDFLGRCSSRLSEAECAIIRGASLVPPPDYTLSLLYNSVLARWWDWSAVMMNAVAAWRRKRIGRLMGAVELLPLAVREEKIASSGDMKRLSAILEQPDVRRRQDDWDEFQWDYLTQLEEPLHFSFDAVVVYALKMNLIERRRKYDLKGGKALFDHELDRLAGQAAHERCAVE